MHSHTDLWYVRACQSKDVPERYGPWATLHTRFRRWAKDRTFERMLQAAQARADVAGSID
ncbi:hypothetical protein Pmi06nite_82130 [Planotetraspora mira]|uniref:Insertion element IS402-like domain-containing protein n=2 Tax=Planotetraspora mira TaxID=58121 RepID=A0A8J3TZM2_9ACTN|nr:hypothetical protein Pmi06nite_82130 [Planotetraspora mira]